MTCYLSVVQMVTLEMWQIITVEFSNLFLQHVSIHESMYVHVLLLWVENVWITYKKSSMNPNSYLIPHTNQILSSIDTDLGSAYPPQILTLTIREEMKNGPWLIF